MLVQMFNDGIPKLLEPFRRFSEGKLTTKANTVCGLQECAGGIDKSAQWLNRHSIAESVFQPLLFAQQSNQLTEKLFFLAAIQPFGADVSD